MKHLDDFNVKRIISETSPEFWEMVRISNWKDAIKKYNRDTRGEHYRDILDEVGMRVYKVYSFDEIKEFEKEYDKLYSKVYDYFNPYYNMIDMGGGDDSWSDFLSSIIGRGKDFLTKVINNPRKLKGMKYMENFQYILQVDYDEYHKVKNKIFYQDIRKFNL